MTGAIKEDRGHKTTQLDAARGYKFWGPSFGTGPRGHNTVVLTPFAFDDHVVCLISTARSVFEREWVFSEKQSEEQSEERIGGDWRGERIREVGW